MKIEDELKITFDDVLIKPAYSDIINREAEIDISVNMFGKRIAPIISSNMDYVTGVDMALAMQKAGALGIINRFENIEEQRKSYLDILLQPLIISVGIRDFIDSLNRVQIFKPNAVCIDVAHGHHKLVADLIKEVVNRGPWVIAGNVATKEGFYDLARVTSDFGGVYAIKVGIGPGSVCTTREVTGCGVPQLSAIMECAQERDK